MAASLQMAHFVARERVRVARAPSDLARIERRFDSRPNASRWCGYATCHRPRLESVGLFVCGPEHACLSVVRTDDGAYDLVDEDGEAVAAGYRLDAVLDLIETL